MLYVTHDQIEAMTLANRIGVLDQGRLVQLGTPQQVYEDPASVSVASRLGSPRINLLPRSALPKLEVPAKVATLGVRAEHIRLHANAEPGGGSAHAEVKVKRVERLSDQFLMHLDLAGTEHDLIASAHPSQVFNQGETLGLELVQSLWFDDAGQRVRS